MCSPCSDPSNSLGLVRHVCGRLEHSAPWATSLAQPVQAVDASGVDVSVVGVSTTHHDKVSQPTTPDEFSSSVRRFTHPRMVAGVRKAAPRKFSIKQMLRKNKFVYNVRKAADDIVEKLMKQTECSNVDLDGFKLEGKTCSQIRRELRKSLAAALQAHADKVAFAKDVGTDDRPRADELEKMVASFPGLDAIDWEADTVKSGINCELWKAWHARHCAACTPTTIHDGCYFKVIHHFLRTGFNAPEDPSQQAEMQQTSPRAYVNKWRRDEQRCDKAFAKWMDECEGLMSDLTSEQPDFFSPMLPVAREKDKWRWKTTGKDYKMRLCLNLKASGYNKRLLDWLFRYCCIDAIAEKIKEGDWMAALDISRFYLRLPAGKRLRRAQWFQDPSSYARNTHDNEQKSAQRLTFRQLLAVAFGLKSAPAWASLVSGELCRILRSF